MNLGDLIGQVHPVQRAPESQIGVVRLQGDAEVAPALGAINEYFGTYADRDLVRIVVGDDDVGYLEREDMGLQGFGAAGFGDSVRATLPGLPFGATAFVARQAGEEPGEEADAAPPGVVEMRCPVESCPENPVYVSILLYSAGDPLTCRVHLGTPLRVRQRT